MPFQFVLHDLLAEIEGAVAVLFIDDEGETVELVCAGIEPDEARLAGAYLGISLRAVGDMVREHALGEARIVHIERGPLHIFLRPLPEGYFLALLQRRPSLAARTRARLSSAGEKLGRQLFPEAAAGAEPGPVADPPSR